MVANRNLLDEISVPLPQAYIIDDLVGGCRGTFRPYVALPRSIMTKQSETSNWRLI